MGQHFRIFIKNEIILVIKSLKLALSIHVNLILIDAEGAIFDELLGVLNPVKQSITFDYIEHLMACNVMRGRRF